MHWGCLPTATSPTQAAGQQQRGFPHRAVDASVEWAEPWAAALVTSTPKNCASQRIGRIPKRDGKWPSSNKRLRIVVADSPILRHFADNSASSLGSGGVPGSLLGRLYFPLKARDYQSHGQACCEVPDIVQTSLKALIPSRIERKCCMLVCRAGAKNLILYCVIVYLSEVSRSHLKKTKNAKPHSEMMTRKCKKRHEKGKKKAAGQKECI